MKKLSLLLNRVKEPSTWAGIAGLAFGVGWINQAEALAVTESLPAIVGGLGSLLAMFLTEKKD